jgi:hypothetical protein
VDRGSIRNVLFQGEGQPAGGMLPTWMTGYGFVFSVTADLSKARQLRGQVRTATTWKLGYDGSDPIERLVAERLALNARDAGVSLQPSSSGGADVRLIRVPLAGADPWITFEELTALLGLPAGKTGGGSVEELYAAEEGALATERVIPLFHLPATYAASPRVRNWRVRADGGLELPNAWLETP